MQLIGSLASPFVRKVRVVLAEKKLEYQFVLEDVWAADSSIGHSNPLGQVPCLIMDGGEAIFDSRVIVEYLDTLSPVGKLIPSNGRERAEVKTWEALADGVMDAGIAARLERHWSGRPAQQQCAAWEERQLEKVERGLAAMNAALGERMYCHGNALTLADIAVVCALDWLDFRHPQLASWHTRHAALRGLQQRLAQRTSFATSMPGVA